MPPLERGQHSDETSPSPPKVVATCWTKITTPFSSWWLKPPPIWTICAVVNLGIGENKQHLKPPPSPSFFWRNKNSDEFSEFPEGRFLAIQIRWTFWPKVAGNTPHVCSIKSDKMIYTSSHNHGSQISNIAVFHWNHDYGRKSKRENPIQRRPKSSFLFPTNWNSKIIDCGLFGAVSFFFRTKNPTYSIYMWHIYKSDTINLW